MKALSDAALERLRSVAAWPDLEGTRYVALDLIACGGMGAVYLAEDRELRRQVALKVMSLPARGGAEVERMLREARILASLEHPGIVPVHDAGLLPDGRVFSVMKLVRGRRLDQVLREPTSMGERLRIFERICEPVAFAHAHGVIHRDLKPENVMLGPFGEVLVMDWGVAKQVAEPEAEVESAATAQVGSPRLATAHGTVLGTPGYMAPEQARGEVGRIDERADVYALGAMLYRLLAGATPGPEAPSLRQVRPKIPRPLSAICRKALAAEPAQRYPGVRELAADIAAYGVGEPVLAYAESLPERLARLAWKHRTPLALVLAYLLMRILLLVFRDRL
jgi:eukaryotic-like serine/threonine-protein kinase